MHIYYSEDDLVQGVQGSRTIFEAQGWQQRLGYDHAGVWTFAGTHDPRLLLDYAEAVSAATSTYLSSLRPEALEDLVETPRGPQSRASRLSGYIVTHKSQHTGEIAALLGCQGAKGLPF